MARNFNGTSDYIEGASAPVTAPPITMACWYRRSVPHSGTMLSLGTAAGSHRYQLYTDTSPGTKRVAAFAADAGSGESVYNGSLINGVWYHGAAVFASTTSRTAYSNGLAAGTNIGPVNPSGLNRTHIGARRNATVASFFNGDLADCAIWNVALSASEIASLAAGMSAARIRPQSLVFYMPAVREAIDVRGGISLTLTGTATVPHPRIYA